MGTQRKKISISLILLIISLLGISVFWFIHCRMVIQYNNEDRIVFGDVPDTSSESEEASTDVALSLYFRGGATDKWIKEENVLDHAHHNLVGAIYETSVDNYGQYDVTDWYMIQYIHQDCYVNNAWCGTIEFHQFDDANVESVQTIDFTQGPPAEITLNYEYRGTDLMIPLRDGDYFIYYPSHEVNEAPVYGTLSSKTGSVKSGIIYYYWDNGMDLSDSILHYRIEKPYTSGSAYSLFLFLISLWGMGMMSYIVYNISSKKMEQREEFFNETLTVFTHFVDAKDPYTKGHSNRVAEYSELLALELGMSPAESKKIYYTALLHDVGKCYIDDAILKKPSRLDSSEFEIIKSHTTLGAKMFKDFKSMPELCDGVLYHHERYDGKGYPSGKVGEDIPFIARIICVADSFDAMNSDRCYRSKLAPEVIINEIKENAGTQFDPSIASAMLKLLDESKIRFDV